MAYDTDAPRIFNLAPLSWPLVARVARRANSIKNCNTTTRRRDAAGAQAFKPLSFCDLINSPISARKLLFVLATLHLMTLVVMTQPTNGERIYPTNSELSSFENNYQLLAHQRRHHQTSSPRATSRYTDYRQSNVDQLARVAPDPSHDEAGSSAPLESDSTINSALPDDDQSSDERDSPVDRVHLLDSHNAQLRAMHDLFERRQLVAPNNNHQALQHASSPVPPLQASQELSPISIGLDPNSPFGLGGPFSLNAGAGNDVVPPPVAPTMPHKQSMSSADEPALPFGLNPLPHLLGFQGGPAPSGFDGPQRGDQSAHSNHHASAPGPDSDSGPSQKVWPKIFRFTDGRINLSDFEKQKKIRLSNKNQHAGDNHIESAPIMFDGRQLKRKSFLILHGGIFSRRR